MNQRRIINVSVLCVTTGMGAILFASGLLATARVAVAQQGVSGSDQENWPDLNAGDVSVSRHAESVYFNVAAMPADRRIRFPRLNNVVMGVSIPQQPDLDPPKFSQDPATWTIELPAATQFPARVRLRLDGDPVLVKRPRTVQPSGDGAIVLSARDATVHGEKLQFEPQTYKNTVGYWVDPQAWAEWYFDIPSRGRYAVRILQGCGNGQGGSRMAVVVSNDGEEETRVDFSVLETGHFQNFQWRDLGAIQLPAGENQLAVRVIRLANKAVMDIRQIRLEPISDDPELNLTETSRPISDVEPDLVVPLMIDVEPKPGRRVRQTVDGYEANSVYHSLYLPTDWKSDQTYPVIVELTGNGDYENSLGDTCSGKVDDASMGYGISGGHGYIWLTVPYLNEQGTSNVQKWWGDPPQYQVEATLDYWQQAIDDVCDNFGGDADRLALVGFSRGAIAVNRLGLCNDRIASRWRAFVCFSHYDGVRTSWPYPGAGRDAAAGRLQRLGDRGQFICSETSAVADSSINATKAYLEKVSPAGRFQIRSTGFVNHSDRWLLRPSDCRAELRDWLASQLSSNSASKIE